MLHYLEKLQRNRAAPIDLRKRGRVRPSAAIAGHGDIPAPVYPSAAYVVITRIWLITSAVALLLKTVPMIYWADPQGERQAEFHLLLGALGIYGLCQLPLERLRRQ